MHPKLKTVPQELMIEIWFHHSHIPFHTADNSYCQDIRNIIKNKGQGVNILTGRDLEDTV